MKKIIYFIFLGCIMTAAPKRAEGWALAKERIIDRFHHEMKLLKSTVAVTEKIIKKEILTSSDKKALYQTAQRVSALGGSIIALIGGYWYVNFMRKKTITQQEKSPNIPVPPPLPQKKEASSKNFLSRNKKQVQQHLNGKQTGPNPDLSAIQGARQKLKSITITKVKPEESQLFSSPQAEQMLQRVQQEDLDEGTSELTQSWLDSPQSNQQSTDQPMVVTPKQPEASSKQQQDLSWQPAQPLLTGSSIGRIKKRRQSLVGQSDIGDENAD